MIDEQIIELTRGPWASTVVLVQTKDRSWQFCMDNWQLNLVTQKDAYPLPHMDDVLKLLWEAQDFSRWIWRVGIGRWWLWRRPMTRLLFARTVGLYQFCVMPFGLDGGMEGLLGEGCLVYLDGIVVHGCTWHTWSVWICYCRCWRGCVKLA